MVVGAGDEIKLMDFGIARLRESSAATRLTRAGMIMGTPLYMAPEQIEGGEVTEKTDIYAFGIVLYEMLSGTVPFRAPTPAAVLMKHLKEVPPPLRKLRGEIPAAVEKVVSRALEKKPERRPATMVEIVESLRSIEAKLPRRQTAATMMMTQTLDVIEDGEAAPRGMFGSLAAEIKDSGAALFRGLLGSTGSKEYDAPAASAPTAYQTSAIADSVGETVALTQPLVASVERKKVPWTWIGVGLTVVALAGIGYFVGENILNRAPDNAASGRETATKPPESIAPSSAKIVSAIVRGEKQELSIGERLQLTLGGRYMDGRESEIRDGVEWRSSDEAIAAIGSGGEIEARKAGKVDVTAQVEGINAAPFAIRVKAPIPAAPHVVSLMIAGGRNEISVGAKALLQARVKYSDGTEGEPKKDIRWESSDRSVASISARGELTGRKEGSAAITAFFEGASSQPLLISVKALPKRPESQTVSDPRGVSRKTDIALYVKSAKGYRDRGAYTEALAELQKARQIDPDNKEVQEEIAATRRACNAEKKLGQTSLNCS
jgi:hypothetical protein